MTFFENLKNKPNFFQNVPKNIMAFKVHYESNSSMFVEYFLKFNQLKSKVNQMYLNKNNPRCDVDTLQNINCKKNT